jgi:hypothetical protein
MLQQNKKVTSRFKHLKTCFEKVSGITAMLLYHNSRKRGGKVFIECQQYNQIADGKAAGDRGKK